MRNLFEFAVILGRQTEIAVLRKEVKIDDGRS